MKRSRHRDSVLNQTQPVDDRTDALVTEWEPTARLWKTRLQMILGFFVPLLLGLKGLSSLSFWIWPKAVSQIPLVDALAHTPVLGLVGGILLVSTSFDLAHLLFTPGPDEAVEPVMTGLAATLLILISEASFTYVTVLSVAALTAAIGFLYWVRERFIQKEREKNECLVLKQ